MSVEQLKHEVARLMNLNAGSTPTEDHAVSEIKVTHVKPAD